MAKVNKYLLQGKTAKAQFHIDLQQIALEYEKLLNKRICYYFQGNIKIEFQFKMENFYHLLGFHKLTDVTVVRMIEDGRMKKEDFYKFVRDGKITLEYTEGTLVEAAYQPIINIGETKRTSAYGEVKAARLAFFTEKNVWELLLSDPVIDFDDSDSDTVIEADKIFFKLISAKNRNLNLFIGHDQSAGSHYTSTFFLEQVKDRYRKRQSGGEQPVLNILSCMVVNTTNNQIEQFIVKWENVRSELSESPHYRAQARLKTWISSKHIESAVVEQEIHIQESLLGEYREKLQELHRNYEIACLIEKLQDENCKEEAVLQLMDYEIDAEDENLIKQYSSVATKEISSEIDCLQQKCDALENKWKKHIQFLPELKLLENEEIKLVYQIYMPDIILELDSQDGWLRQQNLFEDTINPEQFRKKYMDECKNVVTE